MEFEIDGRRHRVDVQRDGARWRTTVDGAEFLVDARRIHDGWSLLLQTLPDARASDAARTSAMPAASHRVALEWQGAGSFMAHTGGRAVALSIARAGSADRLSSSVGPGGAPRQVAAPMPGRIVKVLVKPGDEVQPRQPLIVVEAMKMENELRAPSAGVVADVMVAEGALVEAATVLVTLRETPQPG